MHDEVGGAYKILARPMQRSDHSDDVGADRRVTIMPVPDE